jgi:prepilin-type N-terminal cleavage/methylation domain-containing protein
MRASVHRGLTLLELLIVIAILAVLASLAVPLVSSTTETSQQQATLASLTQLRDVIMNVYRADVNKQLPRPKSGVGTPPRQAKPQLRYLFINPNTETTVADYDPVYRVGWRGPYLLNSSGQYTVDVSRGFTADYGENLDPTVLDAWGRPIVLVEAAGHAWLVSAGPDGNLAVVSGSGPIQPSDDLVLQLY